VHHELTWGPSGDPFLTTAGTLSEALVAAIDSVCGVQPSCPTTGGTSDGRFLARLCRR